MRKVDKNLSKVLVLIFVLIEEGKVIRVNPSFTNKQAPPTRKPISEGKHAISPKKTASETTKARRKSPFLFLNDCFFSKAGLKDKHTPSTLKGKN